MRELLQSALQLVRSFVVNHKTRKIYRDDRHISFRLIVEMNTIEGCFFNDDHCCP